jgi:hypothetical protein
MGVEEVVELVDLLSRAHSDLIPSLSCHVSSGICFARVASRLSHANSSRAWTVGFWNNPTKSLVLNPGP